MRKTLKPHPWTIKAERQVCNISLPLFSWVHHVPPQSVSNLVPPSSLTAFTEVQRWSCWGNVCGDSLTTCNMARWLPRVCLAGSITINSLRSRPHRDGGQLKHWRADTRILGVSSEDPKWFCYSFRTCHQEPTSSQELVQGHTSCRQLGYAEQNWHTRIWQVYKALWLMVKSLRDHKFLLLFLVHFI